MNFIVINKDIRNDNNDYEKEKNDERKMVVTIFVMKNTMTIDALKVKW